LFDNLVLPNFAEVYIQIMSVINKLSKEVFNIATYTKDVLKTNVTNSALKGELTLNQEQLNHFLRLIENSVDQATQRGLVLFEKNARTVLDSDFKNHAASVSQTTTAVRKK
jgi:hypothetical protein